MAGKPVLSAATFWPQVAEELRKFKGDSATWLWSGALQSMAISNGFTTEEARKTSNRDDDCVTAFLRWVRDTFEPEQPEPEVIE